MRSIVSVIVFSILLCLAVSSTASSSILSDNVLVPTGNNLIDLGELIWDMVKNSDGTAIGQLRVRSDTPDNDNWKGTWVFSKALVEKDKVGVGLNLGLYGDLSLADPLKPDRVSGTVGITTSYKVADSVSLGILGEATDVRVLLLANTVKEEDANTTFTIPYLGTHGGTWGLALSSKF